jgi:hypothetical protein
MAVPVLILILTKIGGFKGIRAVIDALAAQRQKHCGDLRRSSIIRKSSTTGYFNRAFSSKSAYRST